MRKYELFYIVPHIKYEKKIRYGFLWLKSKYVEKDNCIQDLGRLFVCNYEDSQIAYDKYKMAMNIDKVKSILSNKYLYGKCRNVEHYIHTHDTKWVKVEDLIKMLSPEDYVKYMEDLKEDVYESFNGTM